MISRRRITSGFLYGIALILVLSSVIISSGCSASAEENRPAKLENVWAEIVPEKGTETEYGISLSLDNTQKFIDWYNSIALSTEEQKVRDEALDSLVAPCCDDFKMSTC